MKIKQHQYDLYLREVIRAIITLGLAKSPAINTISTLIISGICLYLFSAPAWDYILSVLIIRTYDKACYGEIAARMGLVKLEALIENFFNPHEGEN
jgi:hypothetical protein